MTQKIRSPLFVGAVLVALLSGFAFGLSRHSTYRETRMQYITTAIQSAEPIETVILGDSIGESVAWDCGRTFNASVAGATVSDLSRLAPLVARHLRPKTTIVEVGTNHFWKGDDASFEGSYLELIQMIRGRLVLVGVPNSATATAFIKRTAAKSGAAYIEPVVGDLTSDGVHPNARGARVLRERAAAACR